MKRIVSIILAMLLAFGAMAALVGCSPKQEVLTIGEWLCMLENDFGMYSYRTEEPYLAGMSPGDLYFAVAQIAGDYGLLPKDGKINLHAPLTKEFAALSLAKAAGREDFSNMSDAEIAKYSAEKDYCAFAYGGGRRGAKNPVPLAAARASVAVARDKWLDRNYETKSEVQFKDEVVELSPEILADYDEAADQVTLPAEAASELNPGDYYVVENATSYGSIAVFQADSVNIDGDMAVVTNVPGELDLEDFIEDLYVSNSQPIDLMTGIVEDGLGRVVSVPETADLQSATAAPAVVPMMYQGGGAVAQPLKAAKPSAINLDYEMDGLRIQGTVDSDTIVFSVGGKVKFGDKDVDVAVSRSISNLTPVFEYDIKKAALDYSYFVLEYTEKDLLSAKMNTDLLESAFHLDTNIPFSAGLNKIIDALRQTASEEGTWVINVMQVALPGLSNGVWNLVLNIAVKITLSGSATLEISSNKVQGLEVRKNSLPNFIVEEEDRTVNLEMKAKLESTLYLGLSVTFFSAPGIAKGYNAFGLGIEGGAGIECGTQFWLVDGSGELRETQTAAGSSEVFDLAIAAAVAADDPEAGMHVDVCVDGVIYGLLKFTLDEQSDVAKLIKLIQPDFPISIEFYNKQNATWKYIHAEGGSLVSACTHQQGLQDGKKEEESTTAALETVNPSTDFYSDESLSGQLRLPPDSYAFVYLMRLRGQQLGLVEK